MQFKSDHIIKFSAGFLAINLLILIGARTFNYYDDELNIPDLVFSTASVINFIIALIFYGFMSRMDVLYRESQLHKSSLRSLEEALKLMRSERHDFINHLQAVYGLISNGNNKEATTYLKNIGSDCHFNSQLLNIKNPYLRSLLQSKKHDLSMQDISFEISVNSKLEYFNLKPTTVTTVFSNLIDNARDSVKTLAADKVKRIRYEVHEFESYYCLLVMDNGPPVNEDIVNKMFDSGFSTKGNNRGYGLALVKKALDEYQGKIAYDPDIKAFNVILPKQCREADE